jgi:hypothetical protein
VGIQVRPLVLPEIPAVWRLQVGAYDSSLHERPETFASYLRLFPAGFLAALDDDDDLVGYGVGHPWLRGSPVPLDVAELELPSSPTCFHVHDIAVKVKGLEIGRLLLRQLLEVAADERLEVVDLIAVQGAETYWHQFGFRPSEPETQAAQAAYGPTAVYMAAPIGDIDIGPSGRKSP